MKKLVYTLLAVLTLSVTVQAANVDREMEKAEKLAKALDFMGAIDQYKKVIEDDQSNVKAFLGLASCYRITNQPEKAVVWYQKALANNAGSIIDTLHYADALKQIGAYEKAKPMYAAYAEARPEDERGVNGLNSCAQINSWETLPKWYAVENAKALNTSANDYGAYKWDGSVVYSSDRKVARKIDYNYGWTNESYLDVYQTETQGDTVFANTELFQKNINSVYHDADVAFSPTGRFVVFSRNQYKPGFFGGKTKKSEREDLVKLKIMISQWDREKEEYAKPFEASFNNPEFSYANPVFTPNGKFLVFTSDKPGSKGQTDLWYAKVNNDMTFGAPVNLGLTVNTQGKEMFPHFADSTTLYFSSNGLGGLGGLDVYRANVSIDTVITVNSIMNMGMPINSAKDDFAFVTDTSGRGYVSSNRIGGLGKDDIYTTEAQGVLINLNTVSGANLKPVSANLCLLDANGTKLGEVASNEDGYVQLPMLVDEEYHIVVCDEDYITDTLTVSTEGLKAGSTEDKTMLVYPNSNTFLKGIVIEESSKLPVGGSIVTLTNTITGEEWKFDTERDGLFNLAIYPDACYTLTGEKIGYKTDLYEFCTEGLAYNEVVEHTLVLRGGEVVCNIEFNNIYFDYDKADIREDASTDLNVIYEILSRSKDLRVELGAHTDSRGSNAYNNNLSDLRAKSSVEWLVAKGIDRSRLLPKGYGETELKNACKDGVECTEEQHQRNRRVELKVINEKNEVLCTSVEKAF